MQLVMQAGHYNTGIVGSEDASDIAFIQVSVIPVHVHPSKAEHRNEALKGTCIATPCKTGVPSHTLQTRCGN